MMFNAKEIKKVPLPIDNHCTPVSVTELTPSALNAIAACAFEGLARKFRVPLQISPSKSAAV
jgi:hypothetical protein